MIIDPDDICSLEPSRRTSFWEVTLWHPDTGAKLILAEYHDRHRQRGAELASSIAETVRAWTTNG
jgi:hypothetical protein